MIAVKSLFLPEFFSALIHVDQPGKMFRQSSTSQSPMALVSWRSSVEDVEVLRIFSLRPFQCLESQQSDLALKLMTQMDFSYL